MQPQATLRYVLLCGLLIFVLLLSTSPSAKASYFTTAPAKIADATNLACEVRGTWINPYAFENDANRAETLQKIQEANLNTIFLATPPVGDNWGRSTPENFYKFLDDALALNLSVHVWVSNMYRSNEVNFADPVEQEAQKQWILDLLANYPELDGVHFDYIRYNDWDSVNKEKMGGVTNTISGSYAALKAMYPEKKLTTTSFMLHPNYANFYNEDIPQWFRDWFADNPNNKYVDPYSMGYDTVPQHMKYQQNPVGWIDASIVDGVIPMQYTTDDALWQKDVDMFKEFLEYVKNDISKIYMGLGWTEASANNPDWGFDAAGIVRKIEYGRSQGLKGFVIFQIGGYHNPGHGEGDWELVNALSVDSSVNNFDAPFKETVPSCLASSQSEPVEPTPEPTASPTPSATDRITPQPTLIQPTATPTNTPVPESTPITPPSKPTDPVLLPIILSMISPLSVKPDETFQIDVMAEDVSDPGLYGAQLEINYDPTLLSVSNLNINPNLPFVVRNEVDDATGKITLVASQQGRSSGLTGDVTLLTFEATAANQNGVAALNFENVKFSDSQAHGFEVTPNDHTITIAQSTTPEPTDEPTPTPAPTDEATPAPTPQPTAQPTSTPQPTQEPIPPTPLPTEEPTPVPTNEPTPIPTQEPALANISGYVTLPGRAADDWSDAHVIFDEVNVGLTDRSGYFNVSNVSPDSVTTITVDAPGYLAARCTGVLVSPPDTALQNVSLLSGDINNDNLVDITDAAAVGASFGQTGTDLQADITHDDGVDIFDIVLVSVNFGAEGPQSWNCMPN